MTTGFNANEIAAKYAENGETIVELKFEKEGEANWAICKAIEVILNRRLGSTYKQNNPFSIDGVCFYTNHLASIYTNVIVFLIKTETGLRCDYYTGSSSEVLRSSNVNRIDIINFKNKIQAEWDSENVIRVANEERRLAKVQAKFAKERAARIKMEERLEKEKLAAKLAKQHNGK